MKPQINVNPLKLIKKEVPKKENLINIRFLRGIGFFVIKLLCLCKHIAGCNETIMLLKLTANYDIVTY